MDSIPADLIPVSEAATIAGKSFGTIYVWIKDGTLDCVRSPGAAMLVSKAEIERIVSAFVGTRRQRIDLRDEDERFLSKVNVDASGCWLWTGHLNGDGYGSFKLSTGPSILAHRWAYEHWVGPARRKQLHHICHMRRCVNPSHLKPLTPAQHLMQHPRERKTHCPQGHPLTGNNVYVYQRGNFTDYHCRTCARGYAPDAPPRRNKRSAKLDST